MHSFQAQVGGGWHAFLRPGSRGASPGSHNRGQLTLSGAAAMTQMPAYRVTLRHQVPPSSDADKAVVARPDRVTTFEHTNEISL